MKSLTKIALSALSALSLVACASQSNTASLDAQLQGSWRITSALGLSTEQADNEAVINFTDSGSVNGCAGVNNFFGSYQIENDAISFGPMGMTRMMGRNQHIEDSVMKAINDIKTIKVEGSLAKGFNAEGTEILVLSK